LCGQHCVQLDQQHGCMGGVKWCAPSQGGFFLCYLYAL